MACSCIKKTFDLSVSAIGTTKMVIEDQSVWMGPEEGFAGAFLYNVDIKSMTGGGAINSIPLFVSRRNILTAKELYSKKEGDCLLDDIYCFTVVSCGVTFSVTKLFIPSIKCGVDSLFSRAVNAKGEEIANDLRTKVSILEAQAELGRAEDAMAMFKIIKRKLKDLNCECCN